MGTQVKKIILSSLINLVFGVLIGGCVVIPGMSAGTVMILCGIYGALIGHVNGFYKSKKQFISAIIFLVPLGIGGVIGILH